MIDSLRNETVVHDASAGQTLMIKPRGLAAAIDHALVAEDLEFARTRWSETLRSAPRTRLGGVPYRLRMVSSRVARVDQRAHIAFGPIQDIGGRTGWYGVDWFWSLRGLIDPRRGGPGFRRGRRHPRAPGRRPGGHLAG